MLIAPFSGSCLPATASSFAATWTVNPSMVGCLLTKNCTPLSAGVPARPSGPDSGRSTPIFSGFIGGGLEHAAPARIRTAIPASASARAIVDTTRRLSPPANRCE
jgi:hypothetical protein